MKTLFYRPMIVLILSVVLLGACRKKKHEDPKPDGEALQAFFMDNRSNAVQSFSIDAGTGGTVTGQQGTIITFPPNAFTLNGNPVSGNVDIELIELYDRVSMLSANRPTNGELPSGEVEALKSGGTFYINAKQGNDNVELTLPMQIQSTPLPTNQAGQFMQIFHRDREQEDTGDWQEVDEDNDNHPDMAEPIDRQGANSTYYLFDTQHFGWTNLDRWFGFTGPKTQLWVDVPEGYDGDNCEVFLLYSGEPTALARMDVYDDQQGMFTEHYGRLPIGIVVHLVMITEIDGQLYASIKSNITITNNHMETMPDPQPTTQQDLENALNALP